MKNDKFYQLLVSKMEEVAVMPPQSVGPLTPFYKMVVPQLKYSPWRSMSILSMLASVFLYLVFGPILVKLTSVLQFGF